MGEGAEPGGKVESERATRLALLVNPDSGRGDAERAQSELAKLGAAVDVYRISDWEEAARSTPDRIVVAGGDGSIGWAAAAAAAARVPLAVVAAGTANDFARAFGIPDDLGSACGLAMNGARARPVDLGRMGGRPFVNVASVGLPPAAARRARGWKRPLGSLAYALGALRAGLVAQPVECDLRCDGAEVFSGRAWQVTVACTGAFGAGSRVAADPADGALDAVVVDATARPKLVRRAYGLRRGELESQPGVRSFRAHRVDLEVPDGTAYNVDGELVERGSTSMTAVARAFEVIVG